MNDIMAVTPEVPSTGGDHTTARQWAIAALSGAFLITLTNSRAAGPEGVDSGLFILMRLALPVLVMAGYAWRGYLFAERAREFPALRAAQVGHLADSLYFLGFLWTLWALIDSFVIHRMSIPQAVFRTFGYALVTTASGMFLRLLMLQYQHTDRDIWAKSDLDLGMELARVNTELSGVASSLESFRTGTDSALKAWTKSLNESTDSVKTAVQNVQAQTTGLEKSLVALIGASQEQLNARLERMEAHFSDRLEKIVVTALNQFTEKLAPSLERLSAANRKYAEEVDAGSTAIKTSLTAAASSVDNATSANVTSVQTSLQRSSARVSASLEQSGEEIRAGTARFAETLKSQTQSLQLALTEVARQIQQIRVPSDVIERNVAHQTAVMNERLSAGAKALESSIAELTGAFRTSFQEVSHRREQARRKFPWFWMRG
jgi:hypothetical protein